MIQSGRKNAHWDERHVDFLQFLGDRPRDVKEYIRMSECPKTETPVQATESATGLRFPCLSGKVLMVAQKIEW